MLTGTMGRARNQRTRGLPNFWLRYIQSILGKKGYLSVSQELIGMSTSGIRRGERARVPEGAPRGG